MRSMRPDFQSSLAMAGFRPVNGSGIENLASPRKRSGLRCSFAALRMTFTRNTTLLWIALSIGALLPIANAQTLMPTPAPGGGTSPDEETIVPTFETQKLARTYMLDVPAPRGQITDRNGAPLAQNRLSYNLVVNFPTPLDFNDNQTLEFAHRQIAIAQKLLGRQIRIADDAILRHYHNRGIMPFEIAPNLTPK